MIAESPKKKRVLTIFALAFLFVSRWLFYSLEIDTMLNTGVFAAESGFFLLLFGLCIFHAPKIVSLLCLLFGGVGMGVLYTFSKAYGGISVLLPLTYIPVFLFLLNQIEDREDATNKKVSSIWSCIFFVFPLFLLVAVIYAAITEHPEFSSANIYCLVLFALVGLVYVLILRTPVTAQLKKRKNGKKMKAKKDGSVRRIHMVFLFAAVSIVEGGVFLFLTRRQLLGHTLPILWLIDLILLYGEDHALVFSYVLINRRRVNSSLSDYRK